MFKKDLINITLLLVLAVILIDIWIKYINYHNIKNENILLKDINSELINRMEIFEIELEACIIDYNDLIEDNLLSYPRK